MVVFGVACVTTAAALPPSTPGVVVRPLNKQQAILKDGNIRGALTSVLGPDFILHPHRHVHEAFPGKQEQPLHQVSQSLKRIAYSIRQTVGWPNR